MFKVLSIIILVFFIALLPPAALAFVSQDAIPGDSLYPVKRKLEDGIILLVSLNSTSRAWFSASLAQRRFDESTGLLAKNDNVKAVGSLQELVSQTTLTVQDIKKVQNKNTRKQLAKALVKSIDQYNISLTQTKNQLSQTSNQNSKVTPDSNPSTPTASATEEPTTIDVTPIPTSSINPNSTPVATKKSSPSPKASAKASTNPTSTPRVTATAHPTPTPNNQKPPPIVDKIDQTQQELEREKELVQALLTADDGSDQTDDSTPIDPADEDIDSDGWLSLFNSIFK